MKLIRLYIISSLIFLSFNLSGQISASFKPEWEPPVTIVRGAESEVMAVSFKDAFYPQLPDVRIPVFLHRFSLPENSQIDSVKISEIKFMALSESDKALLEGEVLPVSITPEAELVYENGKPVAIVRLIPFAMDESSGAMMKLSDFHLDIYTSSNSRNEKNEFAYAQNSVLATGDWYKIFIGESGIYRLTYDDLKKLGVNMNGLKPDMIRIFGNGGLMLPEIAGARQIDDLAENAIKVVAAKPDAFSQGDYILFYGQGTTGWNLNPFTGRLEHLTHLYADEACYFVTVGPVAGKRIPLDADPAGEPDYVSSEFTDCRVYEKDEVNLIKSGRKWFGEKLDYYNRTFLLPAFQFTEPVADEPVLLRYGFAARSTSGTSSLNVIVNNETVASKTFPKITSKYEFATEASSTVSFNGAGNKLNVQVRFNPAGTTDFGNLDFVSLNVRCRLSYPGTPVLFRDPKSIGTGRITTFTMTNASEGLEVWDVTDITSVKAVRVTISGNQATFKRRTDGLVEMIAHNGNGYKQVRLGEKVRNQNLHSTGNYDLVIVAHPAFRNDARRLAAEHNNMGEISAVVVSLPEIYNEFSSGIQDITAIRDFMKMLYDRGKSAGYPKYLLLFGNASYDVKNRISGNSNFVPTYQSENSVHTVYSHLTDDYYGLLDDGEGGSNLSGLLDVGVGRFPVRTSEQSKVVTDKTILYMKNPASTHGDWRNIILVPADDGDRNTHLNQAEVLVNHIDTLDPVYVVNKIYFDAYKRISTPGGNRFPDAHREIASRVEKGALVMNYIGHGGEVGWADERVLEISDINAWTNYERMGLFFTATCEFSRFDNPQHTSAGELVLLNPDGGAMSMITTTRLAYAATNSRLNVNFADTAFRKNRTVIPRLGDLIKYTKNKGDKTPNTLHLTLFGDPAVRLPMPEHQVITTSIINENTGRPADTLFANSLIRINGEVRSKHGLFMDEFDGEVYIKVFDKPSRVKTLGQHPESYVTEFSTLKNIIYQGKASVEAGKFSLVFPVPRDIDYSFGKGKLSFYATNGVEDANGYYSNVTIGGSVEQSQTDITGPAIRLFMYDTNFVSGGVTSENPRLLAFLHDESGINTVGNGIGHDIVAIIDGDSYDGVVLNDFYTADLDSYQSGVVRYQFFNLADGEHTLTLKAWDVFNNSSQASIDFFVDRKILLSVDEILAYPNPTNEGVKIYFGHNLFDGKFDVELSVFSTSGELVRTIGPVKVLSEGYTSGAIYWDGRTDNGNPARAGLYLCRLVIRDRNGFTSIKTAKVVVVR